MAIVQARKPLRIVVLCGGHSSERDISQRSGKNIASALRAAHYDVTVLDPAKNLQRLVTQVKRFDVAFLALHGAGGEDGTIQGLLESIGLPYTGSRVLASALAMDKVRAKAIFSDRHIPSPAGFEVTSPVWNKGKTVVLDTCKKQLGPMLVVKPVSAGSSVGVALTSNTRELQHALTIALKADPEGRCLVERRIRGRELTVGVLGNARLQALPVVEICPKTDFFDLKAKYDPKLCDELCPAPIPEKIANAAKDLGLRAHIALGCRGYSRTDIMWDDKKDKLYVLETNTLPGMTRESLLPKAAAAAGLDFTALLERMMALAMEKV